MTPTPEEVLARHTFEGELWVPDNLRGAQSVCRDLYAALSASRERVRELEQTIANYRLKYGALIDAAHALRGPESLAKS